MRLDFSKRRTTRKGRRKSERVIALTLVFEKEVMGVMSAPGRKARMRKGSIL